MGYAKLQPVQLNACGMSNFIGLQEDQSFFFGMIWGWLPCGLVYTALALAATTGDVTRSALTMLAFGLGTLPAVLSVGIMTNLMTKLSRVKFFRWFAGLLLIVLAGFAIAPDLIPLKMH